MKPRLASLAMALALVPTASASAAVVNNAGDGPSSCPATCTLRGAVAAGGNVTFASTIHTVTLGATLTVGTSGTNITDAEGDVTVKPSASFTPLVDFSAGPALVQGVSFNDPGGTGIAVEPAVTGVKIQRSPIFGAATPISLGAGSNGGIQPPQRLRVGPRQPDGTLPVTGAAASGARVDIYAGDPAGATPTTFLGAPSASGGAFRFVPGSDLIPGTKVAATATGAGTSRYSATATVPADIISPRLASAVAFSTNEVIVTPSEPLDGRSLGLSDFSLQMAGAPRAITQGGVSPDGTRVYLLSPQPWNPGEAGAISLTRAGAITDRAGNFSLGPSAVVVGAAPGDFQPPLVSSLKLKPGSPCLTKTRRCKHPGVTVSFVTSEPGRALVTVNRQSNRRAGVFVKHVKKPGLFRFKWHGTIHGRKLRAGRYVLEVAMEDGVGNVTDNPPFKIFHIRSS